MSGGAKSKKGNQRQGWEEAGAEFYQESYPTSEPDFVDNPKHLATLLPSKQTRAAATMRLRNNTDTRTFRRNLTARRESTVRRPSAANDVQVAMMPDLSDPGISNEETTWQEIMEIKAMPIPMAQKREYKSKIQNEPNLRLQGFEHFKWKHKRILLKFQSRFKETYQKLELWKGTFKNIEGNYGTGVVAYFIFIKWLMFLNLIMCALICLFILLPTILLENKHSIPCNTTTNPLDCCAYDYFNTNVTINVLDFVQGTGPMERTLFFYGYYTDQIFGYMLDELKMHYNLPLAYILVIIACFLISLIAIVRSASKGFKERLVEGEGQYYHYCNLVFGSWDFCIDNRKSAAKKNEAIFQEITNKLRIERDEEERKNRTRNKKTKIIIARVIVNIIVFIVWIFGGAAIYFTFDFATKQLEQLNSDARKTFELPDIEQITYEFLPSLTIVLLNIIVPFIYSYLVEFEYYSTIFKLRLLLVRTIFLRLASICVLFASLYKKVSVVPKDETECAAKKVPICWETYVGQQIYKLAITDLGVQIFTTFIVNFIRSRIGKLKNRFARFIGEQEFDLPKHVLDVVYFQTVCWFGSFYAPLLPAMYAVMYFLMFYIKRFACLVNSKPSCVVYRASRSNSMFMLVLLVSFAFSILPVAFSISELYPSRSCGPFRGYNSSWQVVSDVFVSSPPWIQGLAYFLTTPGFAVPAFVILGLILYYFVAVTAANRHMVIVLKNQLVLEGHDKQFLLDKLSSFIKQQQQRQKRRQELRENDRTVASS